MTYEIGDMVVWFYDDGKIIDEGNVEFRCIWVDIILEKKSHGMLQVIRMNFDSQKCDIMLMDLHSTNYIRNGGYSTYKLDIYRNGEILTND